MDPAFRSRVLSLVDRGFVYAIAHVRGGQELGRAWYDAGRLLNKRNSFTDFIDVTRFLVARRYADPARVFAMGGSAGGLLVAAVANLAPDDYRALVAHVPFVDIVTTMLDDSIPLTTNEYDEWGNPAAERRVHDYMLSTRPTTTSCAGLSGDAGDDRALGQPGAVLGTGEMGREACARSRPTRTRCCSGPTSRPATAANRGASSATARSPRNTPS